jgi:hypothetical protein
MILTGTIQIGAVGKLHTQISGSALHQIYAPEKRLLFSALVLVHNS